MFKELIDWLEEAANIIADSELPIILNKETALNLAYQMAMAADVIEHLSQEN